MSKKLLIIILLSGLFLSGCQFKSAGQPSDNTAVPPTGGFKVLPPRTPEPGAPTSTAEVNEPAPPKDEKCGLENCHGLEISCGTNVPEMCTEMYQLGDFCRQYAVCETIGGQCQMVPNENFDKCKSCVAECEDLGGEPAFECEAECRTTMNE
jgi:hypothetical protein